MTTEEQYTLEKRLMERIQRETPSLYALNHYTIRGKPITFNIQNRNPRLSRNHRPWQVQILDDQHPDKVVRKSRQLGLSEMGVLENLHFADTKDSVKTMQTFPRKQQILDFVRTRLNPILHENEYFKSILDPNSDSMEVKRIRDSFMMFRSSWGGALGEGADLDFLAMDEYDRQGEDVETAFIEGMKSSAYGYLRRWSTPTIPSRGIDRLFDISDQYFWMHKCQACNEYQVLDIEDNIRQVKPDGVDIVTNSVEDGTFEYVCKKCSKPLDRWYNAEWVPKYPSRQGLRGYHISQLDAVWISADDVMKRQLTYKSTQLFHNYVIGVPFASEGLLVTDDDILANIKNPAPINSRQNYAKVIVGIDWGVTNWYIILGLTAEGKIDLLNLGFFKDDPLKPLDAVKSIASVLVPFDPDLIIADAGFGADRNAYLMQRFRGRVYACQYHTYSGRSKPVDSWNEGARMVTVDKTLKVQRMLHAIKNREIAYFKENEQLMLLIKHLKNVRIMDEENSNGDIYQLATRIGADHLSSCLVYALIGVEKIQNPFKPQNDFQYDFM